MSPPPPFATPLPHVHTLLWASPLVLCACTAQMVSRGHPHARVACAWPGSNRITPLGPLLSGVLPPLLDLLLTRTKKKHTHNTCNNQARCNMGQGEQGAVEGHTRCATTLGGAHTALMRGR
jgi:hypothetical protein